MIRKNKRKILPLNAFHRLSNAITCATIEVSKNTFKRRKDMEARKALIKQLENAGLTEEGANKFADIWFRQEEDR